MNIYVPTNDAIAAEEFKNRHHFVKDKIKICLGVKNIFSFVNDIINKENEPILLMHDDVYFNVDFIQRVDSVISCLNKINVNWGLAGNYGVSCYGLGFSSKNIVRYIVDPQGGPNLRGKIIPVESIDGNTILLNIPKLKEKKVSLPNLNGYYLYDIIFSIETIKCGLGIYVIPQLLCYHADIFDKNAFFEAFNSDSFKTYLKNNIINTQIKTINGVINIPYCNINYKEKIDIKVKSIENNLNSLCKSSVAIVVRTRFERKNLLNRTLTTIKAFMSSIQCKSIYNCYIITDSSYENDEFCEFPVLKTNKLFKDSRLFLIYKASNILKEEYIWFVDDDDWLFPNEADFLTKSIISSPNGSTFFVGCKSFYEEFDTDQINSNCNKCGYFSPNNFFKSISGNNYIPFSGMILQRNKIKEYFDLNKDSLNTVTYFEDFMLELYNFMDHDFFPICIDKVIVGISIRKTGNTITEKNRTIWNISISSVMYNIIKNKGSNMLSYAHDKIYYDKLLTENAEYKHELNSIKNSYSFYVGRFITYFPRKIRNAIRSLKKQGWKYIFHIFSRKINI